MMSNCFFFSFFLPLSSYPCHVVTYICIFSQKFHQKSHKIVLLDDIKIRRGKKNISSSFSCFINIENGNCNRRKGGKKERYWPMWYKIGFFSLIPSKHTKKCERSMAMPMNVYWVLPNKEVKRKICDSVGDSCGNTYQ